MNQGTVFSLKPTGEEAVLHSFTAGNDGGNPSSSLLNFSGTLYGTTTRGGSPDAGTVYSITTAGKENVVYTFPGGPKGANPQAGLINVKGTLYGNTAHGGSGRGFGTVSSLLP